MITPGEGGNNIGNILYPTGAALNPGCIQEGKTIEAALSLIFLLLPFFSGVP
jgi:hypothetical protein